MHAQGRCTRTPRCNHTPHPPSHPPTGVLVQAGVVVLRGCRGRMGHRLPLPGARAGRVGGGWGGEGARCGTPRHVEPPRTHHFPTPHNHAPHAHTACAVCCVEWLAGSCHVLNDVRPPPPHDRLCRLGRAAQGARACACVGVFYFFLFGRVRGAEEGVSPRPCARPPPPHTHTTPPSPPPSGAARALPHRLCWVALRHRSKVLCCADHGVQHVCG